MRCEADACRLAVTVVNGDSAETGCRRALGLRRPDVTDGDDSLSCPQAGRKERRTDDDLVGGDVDVGGVRSDRHGKIHAFLHRQRGCHTHSVCGDWVRGRGVECQPAEAAESISCKMSIDLGWTQILPSASTTVSAAG